ncbi:unnamed protein product [Peniophora sp. CBMAI 1063]|nr:unnamed protein product [Peniophora sp. CBMAI 1063]
MPRMNSFSDDGRSLTPDLDENRMSLEEEHDAPPPPPTVTAAALQRPTIAPIHTAVTEPHAPQFKSPPSAGSLRNRLHFHGPHSHTGMPPIPGSPMVSSSKKYESPKAHFRAAVHKVMAMHRTSYMLSSGPAGVGAEPGIDPRRSSANQQYGHIWQKCVIDIVDYSPLRASFGRMTNGELVRLLDSPEASAREPWVKVRWINVAGISWDVISALALKYDMHPLSLEDILHAGRHARSKADYYPQHLFIRVLCHTLGSESSRDDANIQDAFTPMASGSGWSSNAPTMTGMPRSYSPLPLDDKLGIALGDDESFNIDDPGRTTDLESGRPHPQRTLLARKRRSHVAALTLEELKRGERVPVRIRPMCMFLFRDGTVISFHPESNSTEFTRPIMERIRQRDTSLRRTADPSLLVQSLLDLIVDGALEVVEEYHAKINKLERAVLIKPQVKTVRDLHILSEDLILHKRTLGPIKTLVYGLRRYDVDRCAALVEGGSTEPVVGYMSHKSNIYLADVHDHMEYALASLDMYAAMAENLIGYTFNMASYEMNNVMRTLTLATVIFYPLTLLTGYFGMNFESMWSVQQNSDLLFWKIAIPIMAVVVPLFMWNDIVRATHYVQKRMIERNIEKNLNKKRR